MPLLGELSRYIRKRIDLPKPLLSLGDNVELWMTYLSQTHPCPLVGIDYNQWYLLRRMVMVQEKPDR